MDAQKFKTELARDGFTAASAGEYPPGCVNEDHTHPFEVRGLVLSGKMTISSSDQTQNCTQGDVFVMHPHETHREEVGADGVTYLYGKREA